MTYASTATHTILYIHSYTHNDPLYPQIHPQSYTTTATPSTLNIHSYTMMLYIQSYTHNDAHICKFYRPSFPHSRKSGVSKQHDLNSTHD